MLPELKSPWEPIDEAAAANAVAELARELGPAHPLKKKKVRAVAARRDCDDVLFVLTEEMPACAVVHLTYARKEEPPNWPETHLFASLDDWQRDCMIPDHEDYHAGE
jgi:hypothetical protein